VKEIDHVLSQHNVPTDQYSQSHSL